MRTVHETWDPNIVVLQRLEYNSALYTSRRKLTCRPAGITSGLHNFEPESENGHAHAICLYIFDIYNMIFLYDTMIIYL